MSRLTRAIEQRTARIDAHHAALQTRIARFSGELGERAATPHWLFGAFGAGFLAAMMRRRSADAPPAPADGTPAEGESTLAGLVRQFAIPFAMNLLQQYLRPEPPPQEPVEPPPTD